MIPFSYSNTIRHFMGYGVGKSDKKIDESI